MALPFASERQYFLYKKQKSRLLLDAVKNVRTAEYCNIIKLILDTQQLVVFTDAVGAAE